VAVYGALLLSRDNQNFFQLGHTEYINRDNGDM
jgi:hypothetical protein